MKNIKLYYAGDWGGLYAMPNNSFVHTFNNRLVSFAEPYMFKRWLQYKGTAKGSVIIDSGAFSAWNKGQHIDINKYVEYCLKMDLLAREYNKKLNIVNLDVIPGKPGDSKKLRIFTNKKNTQIIKRATKTGLKNLEIITQAGIKNPIHAIHQGEDLNIIEKALMYTNYIGVSPANDLSKKERGVWIDSFFTFMERNNFKCKTHGLAVISPEFIINNPFTSCDTASWRIASGMGSVYYPIKGLQSDDYTKYSSVKISKHKGVKIPSWVYRDLHRNNMSIEDLCTFEKRMIFNLAFYKKYIKHVNIKRSSTEFKPLKTIL